MDKLEAMTRFVAVAETGSFTLAADRLNLPKSAISASVTKLEQQLQTRLFHRSTRRVTLTEAGERYLPQCLQLLNDIDHLEAQFQQQQGLIAGEIRIDMPTRFATTVVIPYLQQWYQLYPETQLRLLSHDYRIDPIKAGIDCLVRVGDLTNSDLIARPLGKIDMVNCASAEYIERHGMPQTPDELDRHWLIDYSPNVREDNLGFEYVCDAKVVLIPVASQISVSTTEAYLSACLHGLGIAQLPKFSVKGYLQTGELIEILPDYPSEPMPVSILYPSRQQLPKRVKVLMDWIESLFKSHCSN